MSSQTCKHWHLHGTGQAGWGRGGGSERGQLFGRDRPAKTQTKKNLVSVPPKRLFTPLINLFKINALGELKCVAAWQICETFPAKLLITGPFYFSLSFPLIRPFQNSSHTRDLQSEQPIGTRVGSGGVCRTCRRHRADTDNKSSTDEHLRHRPPWFA